MRAAADRVRVMRVTMLAAAALLAALGACADFNAPESSFGLPDVVVANPSFAHDVEPILATRCATGGCHTTRSRRAGMVLERGQAYDNIVGVQAVTSPLKRIEPGNPDESWLIRRIEADPARRDNLPRMPLGSTPLTANQIATIRNWVSQGALRN
ncbi:MAG TPA: hypothetical protein VFS05_11145 [Gemmatimonadaceae bacterium]|nr:hypothetical protein [Gemmatimonadaceae bacterium]